MTHFRAARCSGAAPLRASASPPRRPRQAQWKQDSTFQPNPTEFKEMIPTDPSVHPSYSMKEESHQ